MNIDEYAYDVVYGTGGTVKMIGLAGLSTTALLAIRELSTGAVAAFMGVANIITESDDQKRRSAKQIISEVSEHVVKRATTYSLVGALGLGSVALLFAGKGLQGERVAQFFHPVE